jgi:tetratricopeptide (TPR) repeat protein
MRTFSRGTVIAGRFELEEQTISGGMATVYRARDRASGEVAAVKLLDCRGELEKERFEREARLLAELTHPGIVSYLAHGRTPDGDPFLAMEWLEGEDLAERIARVGLTVAETLMLFQRVCEGLAVAHARGIVHRDIKPPNLFMPGGDAGRAKLHDFGIARATSAAIDMTGTGVTIGTPGYMAPEQARGDRDLDARADVFSLGCVLFECLTGRPPFHGEHIMAVLAKILLEDPPRLGELNAEVPADLEDLVARMLSKEAEGRPADATALLAEIAGMSRLEPASRPSRAAPPPSSASALTGHEQRMIFVVLAARPTWQEAIALAATTPTSTDRGEESALRAAVEPHGARLEWLVDGSVVATVSGAGSAGDLAARAARCALAMRARIAGVPMALAAARAEVTAKIKVGEVIDRAARWTRRDQRVDFVRIDDVTAGLLDVRFDVVHDSEALYLRAERELVEGARTLLGKPTACVGRDRELASLDAFYGECVAESAPRAVLLTAQAGVGKSRVRHEFLGRLRKLDEAPEVLIGRGDPLSEGSSFGVVAQTLRRASGIVAGDSLDAQRMKLRARIGLHLPRNEQARIVAFIGQLAGVLFPDEESVALRAARNDPMLMGHQMRAAWEDWLTAECKVKPVVLVLEDMHWSDHATISFVDGALRNLRDSPLAVLAVARPEIRDRFPALWNQRALTEIRLGELSKKACERLVRDVLGGDVKPDTIDLIVSRADGNAFYLEELIRAVHEGGADSPLPETVLAMVQARLDALPSEARRVLRAASVFGRTFWQEGVRALVGEKTPMPRPSAFSATMVSMFPPSNGEAAPAATSDPLAEWLNQLASRELIERRWDSELGGQVDFQFRNAPIREAAYAMLTESDRALGHRLAGTFFEQVGERDAGVLAEHFDRAHEPAKAVSWYLRAAEQALEGNDLEGAISRAERGVTLGATGRTLGALRLVQAEAHNWRGKFADGEPCAVDAIAQLETASRPWYRAIGEVVTSRGRLGQYGRVAVWGGRLQAVAPTTEAVGAAVTSGARAVTQLLHAGRYDLADRLFGVMAELAQDRAADDPAAMGWVHRTAAHRALSRDNPGEHQRLMERAVACFEEAGDARNACWQRSDLGRAYLDLGMRSRAEEVLNDVLPAAERMGLSFVAAAAKQHLGLALAYAGRTSEALVLGREAAEWFMTEGDRRMEGAARSTLSQVLFLHGDAVAAEAEARLAVEVLKVAAPLRPEALASLARAHLLQGQTASALESACKAFELLESLGGLERGQALVRLVHAEALDAAGKTEPARAAITAARERLFRCAATLGRPELRDGYLANVPENARTVAITLR